MKIMIFDGQGGGLGRALVERVRQELPEAELIAVGTNALATAAMHKAGAAACATGENAVIYNCGQADVIIGALGIGFANSMHGEISPAMARAVSESRAAKLLIPVSKCAVSVMGTAEKGMAAYISEAMEHLHRMTPNR